MFNSALEGDRGCNSRLLFHNGKAKHLSIKLWKNIIFYPKLFPVK